VQFCMCVRVHVRVRVRVCVCVHNSRMSESAIIFLSVPLFVFLSLLPSTSSHPPTHPYVTSDTEKSHSSTIFLSSSRSLSLLCTQYFSLFSSPTHITSDTE